MKTYSSTIEYRMRLFYQTLNEKDRRRYAAIEALKIGHGGISYISKVLGCDRKTIRKGINEVEALDESAASEKRIRKAGGGRKQYQEKEPRIDEMLKNILKNHTAGDPMLEDVIWTDLTPSQIAQKFQKEYKKSISLKVVKKWLKKHNYRLRKAQKSRSMKQVENRNEQFENIARLRKEYENSLNPIISLDTKKKEYLGNYYRPGLLYATEVIKTWDHDFSSFSWGRVIPHGIYDCKLNKGFITIGVSHDTCQFATDCIKKWWYNYGRFDYPDATSILILCDGGGSNSSRAYLFKEYLQKVADEIGIEIRIAHYPSYASKYNPIEHRLFPHVTRAMQGVVFTSYGLVENLIQKTHTKTGLSVEVEINNFEYETKQKYDPDFKENIPIVFDDYLPMWNYRATPTVSKCNINTFHKNHSNIKK